MINALMIAAVILIAIVIMFAPEYGSDPQPRKIEGSQCMLDFMNSNLKPSKWTQKDYDDTISVCRVYYQLNPDAK